MFTGIIEETGKLKSRMRGRESSGIVVECQKVLEGTVVGDSIAVEGVCLTVIGLGKDYFEADVMNETFFRSALGKLPLQSRVNLERAMAADGRFGGHIVSGHIDGTGVVNGIKEDGNAYWYRIGAGKEILRYVVEKGSIAINGISLTVAAVDSQSFQVSVIPHTRSITSIQNLKEGSLVNLECDMIGKYVEKFIGLEQGWDELPGNGTKKRGLTREFLMDNGF